MRVFVLIPAISSVYSMLLVQNKGSIDIIDRKKEGGD